MKHHALIIALLAVNSCGHSNSPTSETANADSVSIAPPPAEGLLVPDTGSTAVAVSDTNNAQVVTTDTVALPAPDCNKQLLTTIEGFKVWKLASGDIIFKAKMAIDADGSPRAYCPDNKGLDWTANAGKPGNWWAVVTDASGKPVIQGPNDPVPGCYVSTTSLMKAGGAKSNPLTYVNSETIPFVALPPELVSPGRVKMGDILYVYNTKNGKSSFAQFADGGPRNKLGEGSIYLAEQLGIKSNPKSGGISEHIIYLIFPSSGAGPGKLLTAAEIAVLGKKRLDQLGGPAIINCLNL